MRQPVLSSTSSPHPPSSVLSFAFVIFSYLQLSGPSNLTPHAGPGAKHFWCIFTAEEKISRRKFSVRFKLFFQNFNNRQQ